MKKQIIGFGLAVSMLLLASTVFAGNVRIATVDNGDMIRMQRLSDDFLAKNPGITLDWVVLKEGDLRKQVTEDIVINGGKFDVMTIGAYEAPIWATKGWLADLSDLPESYDIGDLLDPVRAALSVDGKLYAAPFYAESSMMMYRKDLFDAKGLKMPDQPTWDQVSDFARQLHDPANEQYGICLRGKPHWGENMALITTIANAYGGRWFDNSWEAQFETPEWRNALTFYINLLQSYGPPNVSKNGFSETLALFNAGKCGMWVDATVAASFITDKKASKFHDKVAFAEAPRAVTHLGANWYWSWNLAIPRSSQNTADAKKFVDWATSKGYTNLVVSKEGWASAPPGTRKSLYANPEYLNAAPFAKRVLRAIETADPVKGSLKERPYVGVQFVAIPEFQLFATPVAHYFSLALAGKKTVDDALAGAQSTTERVMVISGYKESNQEGVKLDQHAD